LKLTDLFTPEEFVECMLSDERFNETIANDTLPYFYALGDKGRFSSKDLVTISVTFCMLDELIREKTGESKFVN
jgi:hypothetical protein